ncbi:HAD-IA family hydrolase [Auraticoccus sp. F435]|uniref:HAD-IA family hydrolase n=1 Tax=Auraticoccus cholistanensis TaxID=2656650 RepID=A0A6A9UTQ6_9ACTN|nr:HAD-IA family hydrolase [Auraticoccus cholistanensis]MVA75042.1 HAD-IA family hydrolase [Auraticoccus cholistanensis]
MASTTPPTFPTGGAGPVDGAPGAPGTDEHEAWAADLAAGRQVEIAGVLCDMDGTLVDSVPAVEDAWRALAGEYGVPVPGAGLHGRTAEAVVAALDIPAQERPRAVQRLNEIESRDGQLLDPLPGVRAFLTALPADRWGIVTSASGPVARARFGAAGLPRPAFVVSGDDVAAGKPAPEPFARGLRELRRRGLRGPVLALEDTHAGLRSARAAGCLAVGVTGTQRHDELALRAHHVIDSLEALRVRVSGRRLTVAAVGADRPGL